MLPRVTPESSKHPGRPNSTNGASHLFMIWDGSSILKSIKVGSIRSSESLDERNSLIVSSLSRYGIERAAWVLKYPSPLGQYMKPLFCHVIFIAVFGLRCQRRSRLTMLWLDCAGLTSVRSSQFFITTAPELTTTKRSSLMLFLTVELTPRKQFSPISHPPDITT